MKLFLKLIKSALCGAALVSMSFVPTASANDLLEKEFEKAASECAEFENGVLRSKRAGVKEIELSDDGTGDYIIHYGEVDCSSGNVFWCGNGGCSIVVIAGGKRYEFFARDYEIKQFYDFPILLFAHHGSSCGGAGADPCFSMAFWDGSTLASATKDFDE